MLGAKPDAGGQRAVGDMHQTGGSAVHGVGADGGVACRERLDGAVADGGDRLVRGEPAHTGGLGGQLAGGVGEQVHILRRNAGGSAVGDGKAALRGRAVLGDRDRSGACLFGCDNAVAIHGEHRGIGAAPHRSRTAGESQRILTAGEGGGFFGAEPERGDRLRRRGDVYQTGRRAVCVVGGDGGIAGMQRTHNAAGDRCHAAVGRDPIDLSVRRQLAGAADTQRERRGRNAGRNTLGDFDKTAVAAAVLRRLDAYGACLFGGHHTVLVDGGDGRVRGAPHGSGRARLRKGVLTAHVGACRHGAEADRPRLTCGNIVAHHIAAAVAGKLADLEPAAVEQRALLKEYARILAQYRDDRAALGGSRTQIHVVLCHVAAAAADDRLRRVGRKQGDRDQQNRADDGDAKNNA